MKKLLVLLLFAMLAGCTNELPAAGWCYRYDFRTSSYGFTLNYGTWTPGFGLSPDDQGRFAVTYTHSENVQPTGVVIVAYRGNPNEQIPIKITGKADIFGISTGTLETIVPQDATDRTIYLAYSGGGSAKLEITGEATRTVAILYIDVRGNGTNPFPSSNCSTDAITAGAPIFSVDTDQLYGAITEADAALEDAGTSLVAPDGNPILPAETGAQIFSYAKWLISPAAADEFAGPFSGVITHLGFYLVVMFALSSIYGVFFLGTYIIRWAVWIIKFVLQFIQSIESMVVVGIIGAILIAVFAVVALINPITDVLNQIGNAIKEVMTFLGIGG